MNTAVRRVWNCFSWVIIACWGILVHQVAIADAPMEANAAGRDESKRDVTDRGNGVPLRWRFLGSHAFSEKELRSYLTASGVDPEQVVVTSIPQQKLDEWAKLLSRFYGSKGFFESEIRLEQVMSPEPGGGLVLTASIKEGPRYFLSGMVLEGNYLGRNRDFMGLVQANVGGYFDEQEIQVTLKRFSDLFGRLGHPFASVEVIPKSNDEKKRVEIALKAVPANRMKVSRVLIEGNERTRREVILREVRQGESEWFDASLVRASQERVAGLGLFSNVEINAVPVPTDPQAVDLLIKVTERATGSLNMGIGYSQADKGSVHLNAKQDSVFGSGHRLSFELYSSSYSKKLALSTTNPYFTQGGVSRTLDVYYRSQKPYEGQGGSYELTTSGVGLRFGVPRSKTDALFWGLGLERVNVKDSGGLPKAYEGQGGNYFPLSLGWIRDGRDSILAPTSGGQHRVESEFGLGSDRRYVKLQLQSQKYFPLSRNVTLAFNTFLGIGNGLGGNSFPVLRNFYGGGLGSVRGFEQGTLGPVSEIKDSETGRKVNIGGSRALAINMELIAPFPGADGEPSMRWFVFFDAGNVYDASQRIGSDLRTSTGIGLSWNSPMGPLRFAYARPLRKAATDRTQQVQFQVGASF